MYLNLDNNIVVGYINKNTSSESKYKITFISIKIHIDKCTAVTVKQDFIHHEHVFFTIFCANDVEVDMILFRNVTFFVGTNNISS